MSQKPIEDRLRQLPPGTIIVHGGARGADSIAGYVAELLKFEVRAYPVDHELDGPWPAAGMIRNERMLLAELEGLDLGIAFQKDPILSRGTGGMVKLLRKYEVPTEIIRARDS